MEDATCLLGDSDSHMIESILGNRSKEFGVYSIDSGVSKGL